MLDDRVVEAAHQEHAVFQPAVARLAGDRFIPERGGDRFCCCCHSSILNGRLEVIYSLLWGSFAIFSVSVQALRFAGVRAIIPW